MWLKSAVASIAFALPLILPSPLPAQQACPAPSTVPPLKEDNFFPGQKELDLGDVIAEQSQKEFHVIDDDDLNSYLNVMAQRILSTMPGEHGHVELRLTDLPYLNAFSMPGGRIYVMRKLVAFARNEAELAGVLSHEMGHELSHQGAVTFSYLFRRILGVTDVGDRRDIFAKYNRLMENLRRDPKAMSKISEEEEPDQYQADQIALTAMANAGYDPQAFVDFFDRFAQTKGKTGGWLSDIFGATKPNEKRLRVMKKALAELPPGCRAVSVRSSPQKFEDWQGAVIAYSGLGRRDSLHGLEARKTLSLPLGPELSRLRFSPDGRYILAQDDASIYVVAREPLRTLFRIDAPDVAVSHFTPDSRAVVFRTYGHRVEEWSLENEERETIKDLPLPGGCFQASLSPDGKTYACYTHSFKLSLLDVASGSTIFEKEKLFAPEFVPNPVGYRLYMGAGLSYYTYSWAYLGFSPDGHYFLASHADDILAYDVAARKEIHVGSPLRNSLRGGFAFLDSGRIYGQQGTQQADSILANFPGGEALARLKLGEFHVEGASHGDFILLRGLKEAEMALFDLSQKKMVLTSKTATAADAYGGYFVSERASGEVGLYDKDVKLLQHLDLPNGPLPAARALAVSPDLRWLAFSGTRRGAVWDLAHNERVFFLRNFDAAWFDSEGSLFLDFPKRADLERSIVRADAPNRKMSTVRTIPEEKHVSAHGRFRLYRESLGNSKQLDKNIRLEVRHIRDDSLLWSREFPHEAPVIHVSGDSMVFVWALSSDSARQELKDNPVLASQVSRLKDKGTALLLSAVNASTGAPLGALAMDTGRLSFNVRRAAVFGGRMFLVDNENRTLLYSLTTGEQEAKAFGNALAASQQAKLMAAENEPGVLVLYDLSSFEKRGELKFAHPISLATFSADGQRMFVLTKDQTAYFFEVPKLATAAAASAAR
jgi:hypothetical protein